MENKKQTENTDYQFMKEKIVTRRKNKIRKGILLTVFAVFLAVVFGLVERFVFLLADEPVKKILGLNGSAEEMTPTPMPTPTHRPTPTPVPTPTPEPVITTSPTPEAEGYSENITPMPTGQDENLSSPEEAALENYVLAFARMQKLASVVQRALVTVHVYENGIDWLEDTYETESKTTGIVIEKTEEHILILASLDRLQNASRIEVSNGRESYSANLWNYDKDYNLAVVRLTLKELSKQFVNEIQVAVFGESSSLHVGTPILALGNPNGYIGSVEFGTVTSRGSVYYITDNSVELFNTSTSNGEEGDGVIVNLSGEIIGIITRTVRSEYDEHICTAMGITRLKGSIAKLASGEEKIYLGVRGEDIPMSVLTEQGLFSGIYVTEVLTDSPAFEAGIKTGDIILKFDNLNVYSYNGLNTMLNMHQSGDEVSVFVQRTVRMNPMQVELNVTLTER